MYRRYAYNENMKTLVYVHIHGIMDKELSACVHETSKAVEFTSNYMTYDGIETCVTKGSACVECGLLLEGNPQEDVATRMMEDKLMSLLGS